MVTPPSWSRRTIFHISRRSSTSTPAVGSSRKRIFGWCDSAFAIMTRRFIPPDSVMIFESSSVEQRKILQDLLDECRIAPLSEQAAA